MTNGLKEDIEKVETLRDDVLRKCGMDLDLYEQHNKSLTALLDVARAYDKAVAELPERKECLCGKYTVKKWGCSCGAIAFNTCLDEVAPRWAKREQEVDRLFALDEKEAKRLIQELERLRGENERFNEELEMRGCKCPTTREILLQQELAEAKKEIRFSQDKDGLAVDIIAGLEHENKKLKKRIEKARKIAHQRYTYPRNSNEDNQGWLEIGKALSTQD